MKVFWRQPCDTCGFDGLERVPRAFWMRLLPGLRHYHCDRCKCHLLAPKQAVEARQWMMTTSRNFQPPAPQGRPEAKG